jgi:hypothetical protein
MFAGGVSFHQAVLSGKYVQTEGKVIRGREMPVGSLRFLAEGIAHRSLVGRRATAQTFW